jgi:hypothetical protein
MERAFCFAPAQARGKAFTAKDAKSAKEYLELRMYMRILYTWRSAVDATAAGRHSTQRARCGWGKAFTTEDTESTERKFSSARTGFGAKHRHFPS